MRRYETIYILRPTLSEDEINTIIENTNTILGTDGGQIISLDKWGLRKLAYLIKKEPQGYYVYCDFATAPANVSEMERKFRIDDSVMKYLTVKLADDITEEGIEAARGEHEAEKAAAAAAAEEAEKAAEESRRPEPRKTETAAPKDEAPKAAAAEETPAAKETPAAEESKEATDESDN